MYRNWFLRYILFFLCLCLFLFLFNALFQASFQLFQTRLLYKQVIIP